MSDTAQITMLDSEYDDAFVGLSYNEKGIPFPVYRLEPCARIAAGKMGLSAEDAIDLLGRYEVTNGSIIFVEEMPAGLRVSR